MAAPPIWLRLAVLFVALFLGTRILRTMTDTLTGIVGVSQPAAIVSPARWSGP
jgi:hypothetical protein